MGQKNEEKEDRRVDGKEQYKEEKKEVITKKGEETQTERRTTGEKVMEEKM
jgi:hypothetical protein